MHPHGRYWLIGRLLVLSIVVLLVRAVGFPLGHGIVSPATAAEAVPEVPTKGLVTMVDLGAHKCIPCKMMEPVMAEVTKEYAGRASVIFIDVWEHRDQAPRFGIRAIPTQIFFDKDGKEVLRHEGYMDKASIVKVFEKLGVN